MLQARERLETRKTTISVKNGEVSEQRFTVPVLALLPTLILAAMAADAAHAGECGAVGDLYVCNEIQNNILQFDTDGNFVCQFVEGEIGDPGSGGLHYPADLTWGPNGNLFVTGLLSSDDLGGAVWEYDSKTGAFVREFVPPWSGGLTEPKSLAFGASDGNLYVQDRNDGEGDGGVMRVYDRSSGAFIRSFPLGNEDQWMIKFDTNGNLFVSDETFTSGPVLEQWDPIRGVKVADLIFPAPFESNNRLAGFVRTQTGGHWLACEQFDNQVRKYDGATGELIEIVVDPPGELYGTKEFLKQTIDLAFGPDGNLFVSDRQTWIAEMEPDFPLLGSIHKYDGRTFELLLVFGYQTPPAYPIGDCELYYPQGIEFKPLPGDFGGEMDGGDWDVDLADFAKFQNRFTGEGIATLDTKSLLHFDFDRDGDIDRADLGEFHVALTGPK